MFRIQQDTKTWDSQFSLGKWDYTIETDNTKVIADIVETLNSQSVLDVGCGLGTLASLLSQSIAYTGIDISESAIEKARLLYENGQFRVSTLESEVENNELYDTVVFQEVLYYMKWWGVPTLVKRLHAKNIVVSLYRSPRIKIRIFFFLITTYLKVFLRFEKKEIVVQDTREWEVFLYRL